jgi:hypothetical protein
MDAKLKSKTCLKCNSAVLAALGSKFEKSVTRERTYFCKNSARGIKISDFTLISKKFKK